MNVAWAAEQAIRDGRAAAESLMVDACRVERPGELVTDAETGDVTPGYSAVYEGACKVQAASSVVSSPDAGEHSWAVQQLQVHVPVSVGPVQTDDVVTVTASVYAPHLVGRAFRVAGLAAKSWATAQRLIVEEVVG